VGDEFVIDVLRFAQKLDSESVMYGITLAYVIAFVSEKTEYDTSVSMSVIGWQV
jgi:hypothetical protein